AAHFNTGFSLSRSVSVSLSLSFDGCRRLRLTLLDQSPSLRSHEQPRGKPIGRAFALVQPAYERTTLNTEPIKPVDEKVEVIKVYLEARKEEQQRQEESLKMLSEEVSQIQEEVDVAERDNMREVSRRLYAQLQDTERKHQEERERLQAEGSDLRQRLGEQTERLREAEQDGEQKDVRIEELHRLLGGMEHESAALRDI
ncbi:hypothetical protein CRUP_004096, partial [Coryphaenoides rupestris]